MRRVEARIAAKLCSSASVPAAVGSLSPRRSRRPRGSVRAATGIEIALVPITTAGDRDRTKPFGEIGSRGVFVKELEEALLEGRIDVAVHSAKDMTSSDPDGLVVGAYPAARGSARRALRRERAAAGDADRDGVGPPARAAARARADALDRAAARQHRHAAAQARRARARRRRARGVRARPPRSRRRDRPSLRAGRAAARGGPGLAGAAGARRRGVARRGRRRSRDEASGRGGAPLCRARRRRLPRAGGRLPRRGLR